MHDDHDVDPGVPGNLAGSDQAAQLAFQPVPDDRASHAAPGPEPKPADGLVVGDRPHGEMDALCPAPAPVDRAEDLGQLQPGNRGGGTSVSRQAGISCQRPFRRRRLSVRRPPRVLIRRRKPWTRDRLRFDLFVRCFFMVCGWVR